MKTITLFKFAKTAIAGSAIALISGQSFAALPPSNVALTGTATQSSRYTSIAHPYADSDPANAIDNNTDGNFSDGSISGTFSDQGNGVGNGFSWWSVKLDNEYLVSSINIWNRTDCCSGRLRDFTVTLFDHGAFVWSNGFSASDGPNPSFSFAVGANGLLGDQVRVQLNQREFLSLAEVQVYGLPPVPEPETYALMLAGLGALGFVIRQRK